MAPQKTFRIELAPAAERDLRQLPSAVQTTILSEVQSRLQLEPYREIKTRIKRLTAIIPPLYRLRIGDYRAYYRIAGDRVVVLAVLHKKESDRWLRRF